MVPGSGNVHYPPQTANLLYEAAMVMALAKGGRHIASKKANEHVFGYGVGPVRPGDGLHAGIDGVGELRVKIVSPL